MTEHHNRSHRHECVLFHVGLPDDDEVEYHASLHNMVQYHNYIHTYEYVVEYHKTRLLPTCMIVSSLFIVKGQWWRNYFSELRHVRQTSTLFPLTQYPTVGGGGSNIF